MKLFIILDSEQLICESPDILMTQFTFAKISMTQVL